MATANVYKFFDFQHEKMSVEELDSMKKFDDFPKLCDFYYVEQCENEDCSNCLFNIIQNKVHQQESVVPLQKVCKIKIKKFNCVRLFLKTLGIIEKKRVQAERDFHNTLELWNKPLIRLQYPPPQPLTPPTIPGYHHVQI